MKNTYTTGELAKLCKVTVRTVQYYDRENIIKPSEISEGGRRLYSEDDLKKFRCICLYKSIGFTLDEIKKVMQTENSYSLLLDVILSQQEKLDKEIEKISTTKERLNVVYEQIKETGKVKVKTIEDLERLLVNKKNRRKTDVMTYIFLGCYILILFTGFPIVYSISKIAIFIFLVIAIVLLMGLIYYHSSVNSYICPKCGKKFSIGFWKDLFSFNGFKLGKYLKCPYCRHRGWFRETYLDK